MAIPMGVRLKKMRWSFQAASQAALLHLRLRRLLIVSSVGTTLWMKVATRLLRPSPLVSTLPSLSASSTSPCTHGGQNAEGCTQGPQTSKPQMDSLTPCHGRLAGWRRTAVGRWRQQMWQQISHLAIVADEDPVALGVQPGELLKAGQLLFKELDVQLRVQSLGVVLRRPAHMHAMPLHNVPGQFLCND